MWSFLYPFVSVLGVSRLLHAAAEADQSSHRSLIHGRNYSSLIWTIFFSASMNNHVLWNTSLQITVSLDPVWGILYECRLSDRTSFDVALTCHYNEFQTLTCFVHGMNHTIICQSNRTIRIAHYKGTDRNQRHTYNYHGRKNICIKT